MLSVAESRNQDCLYLKQRHKHDVEANLGEMDWMRLRIQSLEDEVSRVKGRSGGLGRVCLRQGLPGEHGVKRSSYARLSIERSGFEVVAGASRRGHSPSQVSVIFALWCCNAE
jgi:hypothetical protein